MDSQNQLEFPNPGLTVPKPHARGRDFRAQAPQDGASFLCMDGLLSASHHLPSQGDPYLALGDLVLLVSVHHGDGLDSQLLHLVTLRQTWKAKASQLINSLKVLILTSCSLYPLIFLKMLNGSGYRSMQMSNLIN